MGIKKKGGNGNRADELWCGAKWKKKGGERRNLLGEKQPSTSGVAGATKCIDTSQAASTAVKIPVIYTKVEVPETD